MTHSSSQKRWPLSLRRTQRAYVAAVYARSRDPRSRDAQTAFLADLFEITPRSLRLAVRLVDAQRAGAADERSVRDLVRVVLSGRLSLTAAVKRLPKRRRANPISDAVTRFEQHADHLLAECAQLTDALAGRAS